MLFVWIIIRYFWLHGRATKENIWLWVIINGPSRAKPVHHNWKPNSNPADLATVSQQPLHHKCFFFPGLACAVKCCMALIQRFMPYVFQLNFKQGSAGHITTTILELCKSMSYFKKSISHKKCLGHLCDSTIKYIHLFLEKHYSWPHQEDWHQ